MLSRQVKILFTQKTSVGLTKVSYLNSLVQRKLIVIVQIGLFVVFYSNKVENNVIQARELERNILDSFVRLVAVS